MSGTSGAGAFRHGGLRRGSGRPKEATAKLNTKIYRFFWRKANKPIYLKNDVRGTWRMLKAAGSFPSDSAFAGFLLSLEISGRRR